MAVGTRITAYCSSEQGDNYRIRFLESDYVGSNTDVKCYYPGFQLSYQPAANDVSAWVVPSSCDVYLENSETLQLFVDDLLTKQQTDFYVQVDRQINATGSYSPYWRGTVLQDQIQQAEDSYPHLMRIAANDGLALLKGVDYNFSNSRSATSTSPELTDLVKVIFTCLQQGTTVDLWGDDEFYLYTTANWWENAQTYSAVLDPLAEHGLDVRGFEEVRNIQGTEYGPDIVESKYLSCLEVLEEICKVYLARLYQSNGIWIFEQIPERENSLVKRMRYYKDFSLGSLYQAKASVKTLDESTMKVARGVDNLITRLPALKRVMVEQTPYASGYTNLQVLDADDYFDSTAKDYGVFDDEYRMANSGNMVSQALHLEIDFNCLVDWAYSGFTSAGGDVVAYGGTINTGIVEIFPRFRIQIRLEDAYSSDVWYFNGTAWQLTFAEIEVEGGKLSNTSATAGGGTLRYRPRHSNQILLSTSYLPATGRVYVTMNDFVYRKLTATNPNTYSTIVAADLASQSGTVDLALKTHLPRNSSIFLFSVNNPNSEVKDYEVYDYGKITIGDAALNTGNIWIIDQPGTQAANTWNVADGTQQQPIAALLAQQRMLIQSEVLKRYEGMIYMPEGYEYGIGIDEEIYIPHDYTFTAADGTVSGTWHKIGTYTTAGDPIGTPGELSLLSAAARGAFNARVADLESNTQGITYSEGLQIIRDKIFTGAQLRNKTHVITAGPGGSIDIDGSYHSILFKWDGVDGTYTVNLPDAADEGIELEILTDSSITAARDIVLEPSGSQQILEESNHTITAAGRLQIRSIDENWY